MTLRVVPAIFALGLTLTLSGSVPAVAQKGDYSDLKFPRDARGVLEDEDYMDSLEQLEDPVEASIRRLYAIAILSRLSEGCPPGDFFAKLSSYGLKGQRFLFELRADNDLEEAFPRSKYVVEAIKTGALAAGREDADRLIARGACAR